MDTYASVIVDITHSKLDRPFQYRIPHGMEEQIHPGVRVVVPFGNGNRTQIGYVIGIDAKPAIAPERIKEILSIDASGTAIESELIRLAFWIREQYGGTMNQALRTVLPVKRKTQAKKMRYVFLNVTQDEAAEVLSVFQKKHQTARARLLQALMEQSPVPYEAVTGKLHVTASVIRTLEEQGLLRITSERAYRNPFSGISVEDTSIALNPDQERIVSEISQRRKMHDHAPSLIFGVTGSGKTEVYMALIEEAIAEGKQSIVLIPEIALTYQTLIRFYARFGDRVSVLHSKMSAGERFDQYERAKNGELDVMIGPRSALFTPFSNIGYIIIDEEHESSYKSEGVPRYHACDTAIERAKMHSANVVLGSATPSLSSYLKTQQGKWHLYTLPDRVSGQPMPHVEIIDLRSELRTGNRSVLSRRLREQIHDRLEKKEQIMLFLNRRGYAGFVSCRSCGEVIKCSHCDVSMTLHRDKRLYCHYCGDAMVLPKVCSKCGSPYIGTFRAGTQQIESIVQKEFPNARILRMDADSTRKKDGYESILSAFANREADILIGTQMIVKGHDFPGVTLVGILAADLSLHVPDYRASERTFQLLTQASGRAGRGDIPGEVIIQTYQPEHYSILTAADQDYVSFYQQEMIYRKLLHYPPAWEMLLIHIDSENESAADQMASYLDAQINDYYKEESKRSWQKIGPSNAGIAKIEDIYRKVIYIKHNHADALTGLKSFLEEKIEIRNDPNVSIQFDRNPM
jgi:primosomal protein N' (replication factor Y)